MSTVTFMLHVHDDFITRGGHRRVTPPPVVPAVTSVADAVCGTLSRLRHMHDWWNPEAGIAQAIVVLNGTPLTPQQAECLWIEEGDEVRVFPALEGERPGDPGTVFLAAVALISTLASTLIVANSLRVPPSTSSDPEERRFGFNRFSNDAFAGDVLPLVLGFRPRYGGKVIAALPIEDRPDGNGRMKMLIDLSYGPVKRIGQWTSDVDNVLVDNLAAPKVWLNDDQSINIFKGCKVSVRMGTEDQKAIAAFRDTETLHEVGVNGLALLNTSGVDRTGPDASGEAVIYNSADTLDQFLLRVRFPRGLTSISGSGQQNARRVQYRYRTREQEGPGSWSAWTVVTVEKATDTAVLSVQRTADLADPPAIMDVQMERVTAESADAGVVDDMVFDQVVEVRRGNNRYPGRALLALELVANEQLNSLPRVSAEIEGFAGMRVWDGESDPDDPEFTYDYSDNPAACALEFLTNKQFGLGNVYSDANIDWATLLEWWARCDEEIECLTRGGTRPRHRLSLLVAEARNAIDWLRVICDAGVAIPMPSGNLWRFVEDKPRDVAVEVFGDGSIAADESGASTLTYTREASTGGLTRPNQLIVQFENELADGRSEPLVYPQDGELWLGGETPEPVNPRSFKLEGVTDPDQVFARLVQAMKGMRGLSRTIRFATTREMVACQPGDRIDVASSLPGWGLASGRVEAGATSTSLKLDRSVTLEPDTTYRVRVVHSDNSDEIRTVSSPAGTYAAGTAIEISAAWTTTPAEFEEYALGASGIETKPFLVQRVLPEVDEENRLTVSLEALEYDEGVYDPEPGDITLPDYSSLGAIDRAPGPVLAIRAEERIRNGIRQVDVSWSQLPADRAHTGSFRVYRRTLGSALWIPITTGVTVSQAAAVIELGDLDRAYQFVVVAVSPLGAALSPDDPRHPISTVVYGLSAPPPEAPSNPVLTNTGGNTYTLSWDAVVGAVGYQVLAGGDTTSRPNTGAEDCLVLARTIDPQLPGLELPPNVACRFWIRSFGPSGRLSWSAAEISISAPATPAGEAIKHTETFDLSTDGTLDNLDWDATDARLELDVASSPGVWLSGSVDTGSLSLTELTIRPATANDAEDFVISTDPFKVPSIAADQWGTVDEGGDPIVRMIFPPWPDEAQGWLFEIRTSDDEATWSEWEPLAFGGSVQRTMRYAQVRATLETDGLPYRPALRGLTLVATH